MGSNPIKDFTYSLPEELAPKSHFRRFPTYIATTIGGSIVLCITIFTVCILWMTTVLDRQALQNSIIQIKSARTNLLAQSSMLTVDYAIWDGAVSAMRTSDEEWIYQNVGSAALIGKVIQFAYMWGGSLSMPMGWTFGSGDAAQSDLLPDSLKHSIENSLSAGTTDHRPSYDFFEWSSGRLYALSAARFGTVYGAFPDSRTETDGQLIMGMEISSERLEQIANNFFIENLRIEQHQPGDQPYIELPGADHHTVAFIAWDRPQPGVDLLYKLMPVLSMVLIVAVGFFIELARSIKKGANYLILSERKASIAAKTDILTGLPNRAAFNEILLGDVGVDNRAIVFLDLNGFKSINDSAGHAVGDQVIVALGERLKALVQADKILAHISGDEFAFILLGAGATSSIVEFSNKVIAVFDHPFRINENQIHLQAAIGYSVQNGPSTSGLDLMRQADLAMYEAKRCKENRPVRFTELMRRRNDDTFVIEQELRRTLADPRDLCVNYQPIVDLNGTYVRAEALVRWTPKELGQISPARFIPIAERTGMMGELGRLIFRQICLDLVLYPSLRVNVNISPIEFQRQDFVEELAAEVRSFSIDPTRIELELTESIIVEDASWINTIFQDLRARGFSIALDDFGTGYSSISYLDQLSFCTLKLDRSFASKIRSSARRLAVLESMIAMAHRLGLSVVCEGVETYEDLNLLRDLKCDLIQGYLFDAPMKIAELSKRWLELDQSTAAA